MHLCFHCCDVISKALQQIPQYPMIGIKQRGAHFGFALCAAQAIALISTSLMVGLDGLSIQTNLVSFPLNFSVAAKESVMLTISNSMPWTTNPDTESEAYHSRIAQGQRQ